MHRCLHIEEILTSIFEFVLYDVPRKGLRLLVYDKCSVLALVKTCRTFKMPALRVLWKNLLNPNPLLLTMPEDLWHVEEGKISYEPRTFVSDQKCLLRKNEVNDVVEFQKRDTT
jgi:hypothetical protein